MFKCPSLLDSAEAPVPLLYKREVWDGQSVVSGGAGENQQQEQNCIGLHSSHMDVC